MCFVLCVCMYVCICVCVPVFVLVIVFAFYSVGKISNLFSCLAMKLNI